MTPLLSLPKCFVVGNIFKESLRSIWESKEINDLRLLHLNNQRKDIQLCSNCYTFTSVYHAQDDLDEYKERLIPLYKRNDIE